MDMTPEQAEAFDMAMELLESVGFEWDMLDGENEWRVSLPSDDVVDCDMWMRSL